MRAFVIHLGLFVVVVSVLAALNLYRNPDHLWFVWVFLGWGIGVAAHGLVLLLKRSARREEMFSNKRKRGLFIHLFVYLAVNALLIVVNLLYTPTYYWFLLPLVGWGLLLAAHAYLALYRRRAAAASTGNARTGARPAGAKSSGARS